MDTFEPGIVSCSSFLKDKLRSVTSMHWQRATQRFVSGFVVVRVENDSPIQTFSTLHPCHPLVTL